VVISGLELLLRRQRQWQLQQQPQNHHPLPQVVLRTTPVQGELPLAYLITFRRVWRHSIRTSVRIRLPENCHPEVSAVNAMDTVTPSRRSEGCVVPGGLNASAICLVKGRRAPSGELLIHADHPATANYIGMPEN
jgi:hypothetical protein